MAKELVTDELWEVIEPLLPEEPPKPNGGRPRVVERTLSWLNRFRRPKIRYARRAGIHLAFLQLGCALISPRFLG